MTQAFDIAIRHARLRGSADRQHVDISIKDGRIAAIAPGLDGAAATEIDAGGNLVTESFVNPHLHLCKVWTLPMMEEEALRAYQSEGMGAALSGIELASKVKEKYAEGWIVENARRAVALAALYGTLHIRAFADVDSKARLEGVKALIRVRDEFRDLLHEAMALGADVVGGIPWIELTADDAAAHIRTCFDLAQSFGSDVSMLLDDAGDPSLRTLEMWRSKRSLAAGRAGRWRIIAAR
jgi:cytosine deaminase